jgi:two-component system response regulator HydG
MRGNVLLVEDDAALSRAVIADLTDQSFRVEGVHTGFEALSFLEHGDVDVVLTDLRMPAMDGLDLCRQIVERRNELPVVVMTAFGNMDTAVAAIRAGAYDFVTKPIDSDGIALVLDRAVTHRRLRDEVRRLRDAVYVSDALDEIVGESQAMRALRELIQRVATTDATVLITGESGTGKELVARAIHRGSRRRDEAFVAINCAAVPETLIESELFGHARGAFTDARYARTGLLAQADGGTLFLDEIGELPLSAQAKLLRALQERKVRPVGSDREVAFDARIVAATLRDLERDVADGRFREDLYFRIHVLSVSLPPLRARGSDVLLLAQQALRDAAGRMSKQVLGLSPQAAELLLAYSWPGNVRELLNGIEHAVALTSFDHVSPSDLPTRVQNARPRSGPVTSAEGTFEMLPLEEVERRHILGVLGAVQGNKRMAARVLGLDRKTLYRKLERYGVE